MTSSRSRSASDGGRNALDRIIAARGRMNLLIDGLLNLSRVTRAESGHKSVDLSFVSTSAIDRSSA